MNKRQAKKKRKKEQQRAEYYATLVDALAELPAIARKIRDFMRKTLDGLSEALSEIDVEEICKQIKAEKEAEDGTN